jgi:hypothetical protein
MSAIAEVKAAVDRLPGDERRELFRWLSGREDFQQNRLEELRREIATGLEQADRAELAPLDMQAVMREAEQSVLKQGR